MKKDTKGLYIGLGIILVLLIAYFIYAGMQKKNGSNNQTLSSDNSASVTPTPSPTEAPATGTKKLSYGDAIKFYKFRFQFVNCNGNPGILSVKRGTPVMLDNRDKVAHTIKANGQSFRIAGLDYAVLYPNILTSNSTSAANSNITCDGGGAATLNVEK